MFFIRCRKFFNPDDNQGGGSSATEQGTDPNGASTPKEGDQTHDNNSGAKTFTQEEVNTIGAKEKNQGKNSILKLFGCADEKAAKAEAEEFKKWKESHQTEEEKRSIAETQLKNTAAENEKRAVAAENKLAALSAGVTTESLNDALAIALLKVTEEKPLEKVLEEMKKEPKYSGFFGTSSNAGGTGRSADHNNNQGNNGNNIGKRLAESRVKSAPAKSSFFSKS